MNGQNRKKTTDENQPPQRSRPRQVNDSTQSSLQRQPRSAAQSPDDILTALGQIPGLITMGLITTAQANAIRGVYSTMLQRHQHVGRSRDQAHLDDADVMQLLRENPSMLNMLSPLLTDQQIAAVMQQSDDDLTKYDGQT